MPGLLQTAAVQRQRIVPPTDEEVDRWVGHRLARQQVLFREPDPLRLSVMLDRGSAHYLERPDVVAEHAELFRHLQDVALSWDNSLDLIRTVAQERYTP